MIKSATVIWAIRIRTDSHTILLRTRFVFMHERKKKNEASETMFMPSASIGPARTRDTRAHTYYTTQVNSMVADLKFTAGMDAAIVCARA